MTERERLFAEMLLAQSDRLVDAALGGSQHQQEIFAELQTYSPGDWVVMQFALPLNDLDRLGRLIVERREASGDEDWDEATDGPLPEYTYWYLESVDGRLLRWTNVQPHRVFPLTPVDPSATAAWVDEAIKRHGIEQREKE